jgi:hypothetical protein
MESPEITAITASVTVAAEKRRLVEGLAQTLYEASDPGSTPWAKRPLVVRDAWLLRAKQELNGAGDKAE